jgi:hypothetical protein
LQGVSCGQQGWSNSCNHQDCFWAPASGCPSNATPNWGYADSPDTACRGWSSKRTSTCTNPRLDRDNVICNPAVIDPTNVNYCGPENINLDNPNDGDRFVVGVNHYGNTHGTTNAKPHVNLYCNGARILSVGYNPAVGQTAFPLLDTPGRELSGDFWTVATLTAHVSGGTLSKCDIETLPSKVSDPVREGPAGANGGNAICVDHSYASKAFVDTAGQTAPAGSVPTAAAQWCKH